MGTQSVTVTFNYTTTCGSSISSGTIRVPGTINVSNIASGIERISTGSFSAGIYTFTSYNYSQGEHTFDKTSNSPIGTGTIRFTEVRVIGSNGDTLFRQSIDKPILFNTSCNNSSRK